MSLTTTYHGSSFFELLRQDCAHLLPHVQEYQSSVRDPSLPLPLGTTILAVCYADGVLIAGDRRAVEGHRISSRRIEKVYKTDQFSAMAVAGVAGLCIDMAKLFRTELEHYEKIEGEQLTLEGKANKLAHMIRGNLAAALQGLVVVPIFAGYDLQRHKGRIFKYDLIGGRYEEEEHYAAGSGGKDARSTLKKFYRSRMDETAAVKLAVEALADAADVDTATGGPDVLRGIYPSVKRVTLNGVRDIPNEQIETLHTAVLKERFKE